MENTKVAVAREFDFVFADQFILQDSTNSEFYGLLLRGMAHKLNNLLAVIQGFSSLIMMDDVLDETVTENLSHMKEAATNASRLSERILPTGGCSQIILQKLRLAEFLPMIEDSLKEPFEANDVSLNINYPPEIHEIKADPSRLKDILLELMINAAEGGGNASFEIYNPGDFSPIEKNCVDILVKNSGSPISSEKMNKIWEPFYSSKDSTHFGIGLTTAAVLSGQMDMKLGAHSTDKSTVFWLSVPAA